MHIGLRDTVWRSLSDYPFYKFHGKLHKVFCLYDTYGKKLSTEQEAVLDKAVDAIKLLPDVSREMNRGTYRSMRPEYMKEYILSTLNGHLVRVTFTRTFRPDDEEVVIGVITGSHCNTLFIDSPMDLATGKMVAAEIGIDFVRDRWKIENIGDGQVSLLSSWVNACREFDKAVEQTGRRSGRKVLEGHVPVRKLPCGTLENNVTF